MSTGATRFTASTRIRSSWRDLDPLEAAARSLRAAAFVNFLSFRTSTVAVRRPSPPWCSAVRSAGSAAHFLRIFRPSILTALARVEVREQLLGRVAEGLQQHGDVDLPSPIDARVDEVLVVVLDVEPGAAVGDDATAE